MRRGEIIGRADVSHWRYSPLLKQRLESSRFPLTLLKSLVSEEAEYGSIARAVERLSSSQPRYIRITDFDEDGIEPGHEFSSPYPIDESCELKSDDLLFARSGSVGKTYLHEDTSEAAIFAGYCIRYRFDPNKASPRFIYWFTKTRIFKLWVLATQRLAVQANINKEEYNSLVLPLPKDLTIQDNLVAEMDSARAKRRDKIAEADALLTGIDDYVIGIIGLTAMSPPRKTFALPHGGLVGMLNPSRYCAAQLEKQLPFKGCVGEVGTLLDKRCSPQREAETELWDWIRIDDLSNHPWQVDNVRTEMGANIKGTVFEVQQNDILIARLGPTILNAKFVLCPKLTRRTVASSEFLVLRCHTDWQPEAVLWVLRTKLYREIMYLRSRGGTPSRYRLDANDLAAILFPPLTPTMQDDIVTEVRHRRETAQGLRSEAETGWQAAKQWFESQLLED